jgi:hypothetical protein
MRERGFVWVAPIVMVGVVGGMLAVALAGPARATVLPGAVAWTSMWAAAVASDADEPASAEAPAARSVRLDLVAHHDLGGRGLHADVWLHRQVAYVGTWAAGSDRRRGCPGSGVRIVDLHDPTQPVLLGALAEHPGTSAEVMRVRAVETPAFRGDLLAVGLQACGGDALRGVDLWDVTDPREPKRLGFLDVGPGTGGVHELDLVQRVDGRVLALLAVPFSETSHPQQRGDFRIVDVTDPRAPVEVAAWGARAALGAEVGDGLGADAAVYAHSARASRDGLRAYVSYWDAGVIILDLTDPAAPVLVGRTRFPDDAEGNAHSVDVSADGRLLVEADEVLDVERKGVRVEQPPEVAGVVPAAGTLPAPPWPDTTAVTAPVVYLGRGCPAGDWTGLLGGLGGRIEQPDPYPADPAGRIALLDRGACAFVDKLERAKAAGAVGAVLINTGETPLAPTSPQGPLGAFGIPHGAGERLKAALAAGRTVEVTLSADLKGYGNFGGLRLWDLSDPSAPRSLSTYGTPRSQVDPIAGPSEPGRFSAHNPVIVGDLLFASWFSDGVRVLDLRDPGAPQEIAAWVPPAETPSSAVRTYLGEGAQVWGVAVEGDLVVASDINSGLYVLRLVRE